MVFITWFIFGIFIIPFNLFLSKHLKQSPKYFHLPAEIENIWRTSSHEQFYQDYFYFKKFYRYFYKCFFQISLIFVNSFNVFKRFLYEDDTIFTMYSPQTMQGKFLRLRCLIHILKWSITFFIRQHKSWDIFLYGSVRV